MSGVASPPRSDTAPVGEAAGRPPVVIVGIGADGWSGLPATSRAEVLVGSPQQLDLVPASASAVRVPWHAWHARVRGDLVRLTAQQAASAGPPPDWEPAVAVTIWSVTRW